MLKTLLILLLIPIVCFAGDLTIVSGGSGKIPETAITTKASHVVIDITAKTDEDSILKEWTILDEFKKSVELLAKSSSVISVKRVASTYNSRGKGGLFGSYNPTSSYRLRIITPIKESDNVIEPMLRLNKFIEDITIPKNMEIRVGSYALAIENKESYKSDILKRINEKVESTRLGLEGDYKAKLRDFSKEVIAQQNSESTIALYYNYSVSYEQ